MASGDGAYFKIELPTRASVREPIPAPELQYLTGGGALRRIVVNEATLLAIIRDATETLDRMRKCRHATQPRDSCDA